MLAACWTPVFSSSTWAMKLTPHCEFNTFHWLKSLESKHFCSVWCHVVLFLQHVTRIPAGLVFRAQFSSTDIRWDVSSAHTSCLFSDCRWERLWCPQVQDGPAVRWEPLRFTWAVIRFLSMWTRPSLAVIRPLFTLFSIVPVHRWDPLILCTHARPRNNTNDPGERTHRCTREREASLH